MEQELTLFAVIILCDNSAGCDMDVFIATETDTIIDIVCEVDLIRFEFLKLTETFLKKKIKKKNDALAFSKIE